MTDTYKTVVTNTKKIESLLINKLGAEGRGLHTKVESVEDKLSSEVVKKLHYVATIRNKLLHEDGFEITDTNRFLKDSEDIIDYLSTTDFDKGIFSKKFNSNDGVYKKILKTFGWPIAFFIGGIIFTFISPFKFFLMPLHSFDIHELDSVAKLREFIFMSFVQGYAYACIYWGYTTLKSIEPIIKIILFPLCGIVGLFVSPFKIYLGIKQIRA